MWHVFKKINVRKVMLLFQNMEIVTSIELKKFNTFLKSNASLKIKKKYAKNYPLVYKDFSMISLTFIICLVSIEKLTLSKDWGHGVGGGEYFIELFTPKKYFFPNKFKYGPASSRILHCDIMINLDMSSMKV